MQIQDYINQVLSYLQGLNFSIHHTTNKYILTDKSSNHDNNNITIYKDTGVIFTASPNTATKIGIQAHKGAGVDYYFNTVIKQPTRDISDQTKDNEEVEEKVIFANWNSSTGQRALNYIAQKTGATNKEYLQSILLKMDIKALKSRTYQKGENKPFSYQYTIGQNFAYGAFIANGFAAKHTTKETLENNTKPDKRQFKFKGKSSLIGLPYLDNSCKAVVLVEGLDDCISGNYFLSHLGIKFASQNRACTLPSHLLEEIKKAAPSAKLFVLGDIDETGQSFNKNMANFDFKPLFISDLLESIPLLKNALQGKKGLDICDVVHFANSERSKPHFKELYKSIVNWIK